MGAGRSRPRGRPSDPPRGRLSGDRGLQFEPVLAFSVHRCNHPDRCSTGPGLDMTFDVAQIDEVRATARAVRRRLDVDRPVDSHPTPGAVGAGRRRRRAPGSPLRIRVERVESSALWREDEHRGAGAREDVVLALVISSTPRRPAARASIVSVSSSNSESTAATPEFVLRALLSTDDDLGESAADHDCAVGDRRGARHVLCSQGAVESTGRFAFGWSTSAARHRADAADEAAVADLTKRADLTMLLVEQHVGFALRSTDRYYVLESGRITGRGDGGEAAIDGVRAAMAV